MQDFIGNWLVPLATLLVGAIVGFVLDRIILGEVGRILAKQALRTPKRLVDALRGSVLKLVVIVSAYAAVDRAPVAETADVWVRGTLFVLAVFIVTTVVARIAAGALRMYMERPDGTLPATSIFINVIRGVVFVIGVLVVLHHFGISITPILTALGVGGLAVALALQDTLSSLFSGLQILAARQIKPGDFIQLETGESGEVVDITWRNTIVRALPNNEIIIPNSKMANSIVTNFQLPETEMAVPVECEVGYESDLEHVERVVKEVARGTVGTLEGEFSEWEPKVRFHTFGDSGIRFTAMLRTNEFRDQFDLRSEFMKDLKKRFDSEGITIPFPQRVVHRATEDHH